MRPPKNKSITLETDATEQDRKHFGQVSAFMKEVVEGLERGLTRAENFRSQKRVLDFTTGASVATSFPMQFVCELPGRPESVRVGQAVALNGGSFSAEAVSANRWEMADGTNIKINHITGLNPNTRYQITLFIE